MFAFQSAQHPQKMPLVQALHIHLQNQQRTTRLLLFTCVTAKMKNNPKPDKKKAAKKVGDFSFLLSIAKKKLLLLIFFFFLFKSFELLSPFFFLSFKAKQKDLNMFAPLPVTNVSKSWSCINSSRVKISQLNQANIGY